MKSLELTSGDLLLVQKDDAVVLVVYRDKTQAGNLWVTAKNAEFMVQLGKVLFCFKEGSLEHNTLAESVDHSFTPLSGPDAASLDRERIGLKMGQLAAERELRKEFPILKPVVEIPETVPNPVLTAIGRLGFEIDSHNHGRHFVIKTSEGSVDFWPGTGRWTSRFSKDCGLSINGLLAFLQTQRI